MKFQITEIEFDFDDEYDLVDEITCATGWCIKSLDYRHVLNTH